MRHPPYHLRANKAADRLLLIETISRLVRSTNSKLDDYTYYGFGGPFLEDFKIIRKYLPEVRLVSIEKNKDTFNRQIFHKFCRDIQLINAPFDRFLSRAYKPGKRDIFWIDFTDLKPCYLEWLTQLIPKLGVGSLVKITFPAVPPLRPEVLVNLNDDSKTEASSEIVDRFEQKFDRYITSDFSSRLMDQESFACLTVDMIRSTIGKFRAPKDQTLRMISAHRYADGAPMVSCAFALIASNSVGAVEREMDNWGLAKGAASSPRLLSLPLLSIQERIKLDSLLPQKSPTGKSLSRSLGYKIDDSDEMSVQGLCHYAEFQRYFPLFGRLEF